MKKIILFLILLGVSFKAYTEVSISPCIQQTDISYWDIDNNYYGAFEYQIGWGLQYNQMLIQMDFSNLSIYSTQIDEARLYLFRWREWNDLSIPSGIDLYRVIGPWEQTTVTWNTQPAVDTIIGTMPLIHYQYVYGEWSYMSVWDSSTITAEVINIISGNIINYGWFLYKPVFSWGVFAYSSINIDSSFQWLENYKPYVIVSWHWLPNQVRKYLPVVVNYSIKQSLPLKTL